MTYNNEIAKLNKRIEKLQKEKNPKYALIDDLINEVSILEIEGNL